MRWYKSLKVTSLLLPLVLFKAVIPSLASSWTVSSERKVEEFRVVPVGGKEVRECTPRTCFVIGLLSGEPSLNQKCLLRNT